MRWAALVVGLWLAVTLVGWILSLALMGALDRLAL